MAPKTSSVDIAVISDDQSLTDYELMEKMYQIEEQQKQKEKELEKQQRKADPDATLKAYRASHFFCTRSKTVIPKKDEARIIEHKSLCPWCTEARQEREAEKEARHEGLASMRYILGTIERAKDEIETQTRKIKREREEQQNNYQVIIEMCEHKIAESKNTIKREERERDKLLNHENEITRSAAMQMYNENYLKLSDKDRKRVHLYDETL